MFTVCLFQWYLCGLTCSVFLPWMSAVEMRGKWCLQLREVNVVVIACEGVKWFNDDCYQLLLSVHSSSVWLSHQRVLCCWLCLFVFSTVLLMIIFSQLLSQYRISCFTYVKQTGWQMRPFQLFKMFPVGIICNHFHWCFVTCLSRLWCIVRDLVVAVNHSRRLCSLCVDNYCCHYILDGLLRLNDNGRTSQW